MRLPVFSLSTLTSRQMIWSRCPSLASPRERLRSLGWFSHTSHQSKHNRTKGQTRSLLLQSSRVVEKLILLHKHVQERDVLSSGLLFHVSRLSRHYVLVEFIGKNPHFRKIPNPNFTKHSALMITTVQKSI